MEVGRSKEKVGGKKKKTGNECPRSLRKLEGVFWWTVKSYWGQEVDFSTLRKGDMSSTRKNECISEKGTDAVAKMKIYGKGTALEDMIKKDGKAVVEWLE